MQYFDVLMSFSWIGSGDKSYYFVTTVKSDNAATARVRARRKMIRFFESNNREILSSCVHGVGHTGVYGGFIGKYVGQFIDEAFPQC